MLICLTCTGDAEKCPCPLLCPICKAVELPDKDRLTSDFASWGYAVCSAACKALGDKQHRNPTYCSPGRRMNGSYPL